jgi:hypothetical protein
MRMIYLAIFVKNRGGTVLATNGRPPMARNFFRVVGFPFRLAVATVFMLVLVFVALFEPDAAIEGFELLGKFLWPA